LKIEGEMLMKKSLIALAVAGALTAPMVAQADATLYGSIRVLVVDQDNTELDVQDGTSRIGIKGDVDLGIEGVKGVYQFETRLRADNGEFAGVGERNARLSYVGATGDFGTALAGRMYTPHWLWTSAVADASWNDAVIGVVGETALRQPNTLAYITPNMGGFQAAGAIIADATGGSNDFGTEDVDAYNVAVKYAANGLHVGLSLVTVDTGAVELDDVGVAASYKFDAATVYARYQDDEVAAGSTTGIETTQIGGSYVMGDTTLQLRWTNTEQGAVDADQIAVGVQQMLGKQGRVFAEYANVDTGFLGLQGSNDRLSVGYRLDF
jgi:predicted porin